MSLPDPWLQPLRAYPREFVLGCAALGLAAVLWVAVKIARWSVFTVAVAIFVLATGGLALWLWE